MARPGGPYVTLVGRIAVDRAAVRLGQVREVLVDDVTGRPEWLVIATGVLGARQKVVPIALDDLRDALRDALAAGAGERRHLQPITIPVDHAHVLSGPRVQPVRGQLTQDAEEALYLHYGLTADEPPAAGMRDATESSGHAVGDPQPQPRRDPLGEIARAASAVLFDPEWLDHLIEKLVAESSQQDREHP